MFENQDQEWRRLTAHYAEMCDEELLELAAEYNDLTDMAKQALGDEMKRRRLGEPAAHSLVANGASAKSLPPDDGSARLDESNPWLVAADVSQQNAPEPNKWWIRAYETDDTEKGRQYATMLVNAGINIFPHTDPFGIYIIEVAADQADQAQLVLAQPIPRCVIEDSGVEVPDFEPPRCPRCRSEESVLLDTDPTNHWHCDSCGNVTRRQ